MGLLDLGLSSGRSSIISTSEVIAREGVDLKKSMNFRDDGMRLSVFLSLERSDGYHDHWHEEDALYAFEGHDSNAEGAAGKADDQLLMYASGKPTDNGRFWKAANAFKDGQRADALQIQVYEKLEAGAWYDKGIFNLVDAVRVPAGGRKVCLFYLQPADAGTPLDERDADWIERMIPAAEKAEAWKHCGGRCAVCKAEANLFFVAGENGELELRCADHSV